MSATLRVFLALVAGLSFGVLLPLVDSALGERVAAIIGPLGTLWVNAIRMTVIPLVVSLLFVGIAASPDARSVGRVSGRAILLFVGLLGVMAAMASLVAEPIFRAMRVDPDVAATLRQAAASAPAAPAELPRFADWLTGLVTTNPVRTAADGALLPLIIFVLLFALATTRTAGEDRRALVAFFRALGNAMLVLVRWVLAVAPIGVFALAYVLASRMGAAAAGAIGFFIVVFSLAMILCTLALYPLVSLAAGIPVRQFARAILPAQVVAASARSSLAALPAMLEAADTKLRLATRVSGLVLPLAVSTFKLNSGAGTLLSAAFIARLYGVDLSVAQLALFALAGVALSFYAPGIPSGGLFLKAPIYMAVGLPVEGIGVLIAVDMIPDIFKSALNVTGDMAVAAIVARHAGAEAPIAPPLAALESVVPAAAGAGYA